MSRSNGPINPQRGPAPPQWPSAAEQDAHAQQAYAAAQQRYQQPSYGSVQGQPPYQPQPAAAPTPNHAYGQPAGQQSHYGHYAAPAHPPIAPASQNPAYQPVFERYAPPPEPRTYDPRLAPQQPRTAPRPQAPVQQQPVPPQQHAAPQPPPSVYDTHAAAAAGVLPRGAIYDNWPQANPQQPAAHQPPAPAPAQRNYDFSVYGAAQPAGEQAAAQPAPQMRMPPPAAPVHGHAHPSAMPPMAVPTTQPPTHPGHAQRAPAQQPEQQWQLDAPHAHGNAPAQHHAADAHHEPAFDRQAYADDAGGQLQTGHHEEEYEADDQPDYEDDEPKRGKRGLLMVSALVGAIALGGGLAYGYKTFMKPPASGAAVGKVAAPKGPSKTQPADPGGKQFPNQESKLQSRLGEGSAPAGTVTAAAAPIDSEGGVKRVPTVVIGRDGSVSAPPPVPGMVVVQPQPMPAAPAPVAPPAPAPVVSAPVAPPQAAPAPVPQPRVAAVTPRAAVPVVNAAPAEPPPAPPAPVAKKAAVKKAAPVRDDLVATGATGAASAPAAAAPKSSGSGFVAVLASKGSKAEAQRTNTEMEQRFDVLKGKIFDVQEANLTAQGKGIYYRSVVGPPGSREFASGVCSQLKAAGYSDCWITAY